MAPLNMPYSCSSFLVWTLYLLSILIHGVRGYIHVHLTPTLASGAPSIMKLGRHVGPLSCDIQLP
jgi:hypothetical protein